MRKQLIKSGLGIILVKMAGTLLTFVLSIALARILGAAGYGVYSFALSMLMLLSIPIQSGIPTLAVREVARSLVGGDHGTIKMIWSWANRIVLGYFTALCLMVAVFMFFSGGWVESERFYVFLAGILAIPLISLTLMQSAIVRGIGKIVLGVISDGFIRPFINLLLVLTVFLILTPMELTAVEAMLLYMMSVAMGFLISLLILGKSTNRFVGANGKGKVFPERWRSSLASLTVVGGVQLMFGYSDILIIGFYYGDAQIGLYKVAVQLSLLVSFVLTILNQMLQPYFSSMYASSETKRLQDLVLFSSIIIFTAAAIPAISFLLFSEELLALIYGEEYLSGAIALQILVIGQLANSAFGSVGALLNMTGHERDSMKGMLLAIVVNVSLNFILIPKFGIEGAAVSSALSFVIWNYVLRYFVKKRLKIESSGVAYYLTKNVLNKVGK
jgi:O-antigen/teichoic acid export membrane protein